MNKRRELVRYSSFGIAYMGAVFGGAELGSSGHIVWAFIVMGAGVLACLLITR